MTRDEEIKMLRLKIAKLENEQKAEDLKTFRNKLIAYLKDLLAMVVKWGITFVDIEHKRGVLTGYCSARACPNCPMAQMCDNLPGDILKDITQERLERAIKQLEEEATE
jgi:hypothetical protein